MSAVMDLYPAIDLRAGRCVRLLEGDYDAETVYGDDPVAVAESFAAAGATWIHIVDLDAARSGEPSNRPVVAAIAAATDGVSVQVGGGVRSPSDAEELIGLGVTRVVVGTAAVEDPEVVSEIHRRWPGRVAVGLDHRGGELRVRGWTQGSGARVEEVIPDLAERGAAAFVVTDISRDGRLAGPDIDGLSALLSSFEVDVIASGGVAGPGDVAALAALRSAGGRTLAGAIAGKAIYEGRLDVAQTIAELRRGTR